VKLARQQLLISVQLSMASENKGAAICGGEVHVEHLDRGELVEHRPGGEASYRRPEPGAQRCAQALLDEAMALFADPVFAPVFAEGSRAEVPIAGMPQVRGAEQPVSGMIDHLVDRVLIVETNRDPPLVPKDAPKAYLAQLTTYRRLMADIHPGRTIGAALLWTAAPRLMALPAGMLDEVLEG